MATTLEVPATTKKDAATIAAKFDVIEQREFRGELTLVVNRAHFHPIAAFCRDELGYTYLIDISSVDHFGAEPRFEMVYELQNFERADHLRLNYTVSEDDISVPTVTDLWATADWHEREVFDMMGIRFTGHPDLRRILMWEGYPFHPLRKDFPLAGKDSDTPDVAFSRAAPLAGGPFVTSPTGGDTQDREPRSREME
jgi:NADH-quinone oxidoreductase subunit C